MLKVGDRVRSTGTHADITEGREYVVLERDDDDNSVRVKDDVGDRWWLFEGDYELVPVAEATSGKFKVGDRVRVHNHPYYLEEDEHTGTIISRSDKRGDWDVDLDNYGGADLSFRENELTLTPTLTIQPGKFYKTRDGRKVGPMLIWDKDSEWPWSDHADSGSGIWRGDGSVFDHCEDDDDLIAEWVDNPQPANDNSTAGFTIPLCALEAEPDLTAIGKAYADGYAAGLAARQAA